MANQYQKWTEAEDRFLRQHHAGMTAQQMADALGRSRSAVVTRRSDLGLRKTHQWTPEEDAFLRANYLHMNNAELYEALDLPPCPAPKTAISNRMRRLNLVRPDAVREKLQTDSYFKKGHVPFNKGRYMRVSQRTEFKKGNLPANTLYDGAIRVRVHKRTQTSYKYIRVALGKWELLHRYNWQQAHGPIPKTHIVIFKDGDTLNCELENLDLISKADNARRNRDQEKITAGIKKAWAKNQHFKSDKYIAAMLAQRDSDLRAEVLKHPGIIEMKRKQLTLQRRIKHDQTTDA